MEYSTIDNLQLIECVVNISEGHNQQTIGLISNVLIENGARVLHVDSGADANRTVITFVVQPLDLFAAATALYDTALRHIDMNTHNGAHPCIGAVDVFPLVPLKGISFSDTILLSQQLAKHISEHFNLPVYLYALSAISEKRSQLHTLRKGGYQGLAAKLATPESLPDYGPSRPHSTAGATIIGCRDFLIAYNVTLDSQDLSLAKRLAAKTRQLPGVRALGWFLPEYNATQVSCNIINYRLTNPLDLYNYVNNLAQENGTAVLGSELIGLIPLAAIEACFLSSDTLRQGSTVNFDTLTTALNLKLHQPSFNLAERCLENLLAAQSSLISSES